MPQQNLTLVIQPLAQNASAHPLDVLKMKSILGALGHYDAPDWGLSEFPDPALFEALRHVQRAHGLQVDGVMKPGGETERTVLENLTLGQAASAIRAAAAAVQSMGRNGDTILAHLTPEEAQFLDAVTDGGSVNPHTGLLEFWSGKGGYNGPDRTHTSKDRDRGGFDASADQKSIQNSVAFKGERDGNDVRARTGNKGNIARALDPAKQTQATSPARPGNDGGHTTLGQSRRTRTVLTPDNDPSFTSGLLDKNTVSVSKENNPYGRVEVRETYQYW